MEIDKNAVDRLLDWHRLGVNPGGIASALQAEGLPVPPGAGPWSASTVQTILDSIDGIAAGDSGAEPSEPEGEDGDEDWTLEHCGNRFVRPWVTTSGTWRGIDVKEAPEASPRAGSKGTSRTSADLAVESLERAEQPEFLPPQKSMKSTAQS